VIVNIANDILPLVCILNVILDLFKVDPCEFSLRSTAANAISPGQAMPIIFVRLYGNRFVLCENKFQRE